MPVGLPKEDMKMPQCTKFGCGKSWEPGTGDFPLCFENDCPLREVWDHLQGQSSRNVFRTRSGPETMQGTCLVAGQVSQSLDWLRGSCGKTFQPYDMKGAKSASTTVTLRNGEKKTCTTTDQMHSEMVAIRWMIQNGHWKIYLGEVVWADDEASITLAQFSTTEPHCGFCTVFLIAAGLPVGTPTYGNYQLASRLSYQLPVELEISPHFIARVLDRGCYCGFSALKRMLNAFINLSPNQWLLSIYDLAFVDDRSYVPRNDSLTIVGWNQLVEMHNREIIYLAWKVIYQQLMQTNKEH
jgi:hypothetical protein